VKPGLADVGTTSLERIRDALRAATLRAPLSRSSLVAFGVRGQLDALVDALEGHSREACLSVLDAVLAERAKYTRPAPELVWTGPEGASASARDTAVVLRDLFEKSRSRVVLAGYSFSDAESVLAPLHDAMTQHGVEAHFFVDVKQPDVPAQSEEAYGRAALEGFLRGNWPFGPPYPELYCDRRALRPGRGAEYCSLHAKCVAVDGQRAFLSSANFTARGQERNIEAGVLIHDATFALQLERQWMSLVEGDFCLRYLRS
jgi:phosphatidylserine/phosphatidylglycerophosphate/cardiolipin synthase-like enzyme